MGQDAVRKPKVTTLGVNSRASTGEGVANRDHKWRLPTSSNVFERATSVTNHDEDSTILTRLLKTNQSCEVTEPARAGAR